MVQQVQSRSWFGGLLVFLFVLSLAGCGGGGTDPSTNTQNNPSLDNAETIHADAGLIVAVRVGELAYLDGSASTTTLPGPLTYRWSFSYKPTGSTAVLQNAGSATPSFTADVAGTYMVDLLVNVGATSARATGFVEVSVSGNLTGKRVHTLYPARCADCHDGRYEIVDPPFNPVPGKSANHMPTSNACETCHTTFGFKLARQVDHQEVFGVCSSCHDGVTAIGKSDFHIPTTAECSDCHTTDSFFTLGPNGKFDHTGIVSGCAACHNGTTAIGKTPTHIVTTSDCSNCHTTAAFKPAYVDHTNITSNCASCHDGSQARGPITGHPVVSVDCSVCHSTRSFNMGGIFDHSLVSTADEPCSTCHNDTNGIGAPGKIAGHLVTTSDCGNCHTTIMFKPAFVDHTGPDVVGKRCDSCHGVSAVGKHVNHMPTTEDCSVCHTPGTFTTGFFDHNPTALTGVTCASCHDGLISVGKGVFHIPTTADCNACHFNTVSFAGATFDHAGIDVNNCSGCHNGEIAINKPLNHIPTSDDCSACHADTMTGGFKNSSFLASVHPGITTGCQSCHTPTILPLFSKTSAHIPTNLECNSCHSNALFKPANFTHQGINNNCALCHNGQYVSSGATAKKIGHIATNDDCSACHNTTTFVGGFVDHTLPSVVAARCDSCHGVTATGKNVGHITTTQDCGVCHVAGGAFKPAIFDHTGIVDNCASCHDGVSAKGKPTTHVPTSADCSQCHVTTGFLPATFSHAGIVDNCASCHDGSFARGKPNTHIPTSADCGLCHTPAGFIPATFDHSTVTNATRCDSCHGISATGKPNTHLSTTLDCRNCHTTATFVGGTWDHTGITGGCSTCHDGTTATGQGNGHFITSQECNACHSTTGWVPANTYKHSPAGNYPGDHARALTCMTCHTGNNETISFRWPTYAPACAACHAGDYKSGPHRGTLNDNKNCGQSGCHKPSWREW